MKFERNRNGLWTPRSTCDVVEIGAFNALGGGGVPVLRTFQDSFNRAGGVLGNNWLQTMGSSTPITDPVNSATFSVGTCADLAQGMIVSNVGNANPNITWTAGILAMPVYMICNGSQLAGGVANALALSQYSSWQLVRMDRVGANDAFGGPAVLFQNPGRQSVGIQTSGLYGYYILVFASDKSYQLNRGNGFVATNLVSGPAATFTANDVIRLEAVVAVGGGSVALTVKKNGTVINSFLDNTGARILTGGPGWYGQGFDNSAGGSMTNQWRNFDGGLL